MPVEPQSKQRKKYRSWNINFELLRAYKKKHGNCNVPWRYEKDRKLGKWVYNQRWSRRKESLSDEKIAKLDSIGFSWNPHNDNWNAMFEQLVQYAIEHGGDCNIAAESSDNPKLAQWVYQQRQMQGVLSEDRRAKLDELGFIWEESNLVKDDQHWLEMLNRLKEYHQDHGDCRVPQKWEDDEEPYLGRWVKRQRFLYKRGLLQDDRKNTLQAMNFTWVIRNKGEVYSPKLEKQWKRQYKNLTAFYEENNHCNVPRKYEKDQSLGHWVDTQRKLNSQGLLREDRKELLDAIGFTWSFENQLNLQWSEKYNELCSFQQEYGHLRVPKSGYENLLDWIRFQHLQEAKGTLNPQ